MLGVHLHILDADTKQPTAVRLRITGPAGEHFVHYGHVNVFPSGRGEDVGGHLRFGEKQYRYIDGRCEVKLPANVPITIEAFKGFEFRPLKEVVTLGTGQISIRLKIERWSNLAAEGWVSGDSGVHFLSPHAALFEAAAEDISIVNLLAMTHPYLGIDGNTYLTNSNLIAFSGQLSAISQNERAVFVNTLNVHPVLGKLALLNCHRLVYPLSFGEPDDWSLFDWCQQCHRKNGLAAWVDAFQGGEALVAAILGKLDALEVACNAKPWLPLWNKPLNCGIRLPLVGGSGKDANNLPLGAMRTYTRADSTYPSWIEAVRSGKTFVTNGPLLDVRVAASRTTATVKSIVPFDSLDLIADGDAIASATAIESDGVFSATIQKEMTRSEYAWLAARCVGKPSVLLPTMPVFAHTSPVYGTASLRDTGSKPFQEMIENTMEWARERGQFTDEKWRTQLLSNCEEALTRIISPGSPV